MSWIDTAESWLKGGVGPVVGFVLGLASAHGPTLWRRIKGKSDLQVYVEHDPAIIFANAPRNTVGCPMFVPGSPDDLSPGPNQDAFSLRRWALEHDGIPAGADFVEVTLTAWQKLDVVVDAVEVNCREISIPDGFVEWPTVGGADIHRRRLDVRLASCGSRAEYVDPTGSTPNFSFKLSSGETAKIHLNAATANWGNEQERAYEWTVDLHLLVNNNRKTITIGDNGKPFELVRSEAFPTRSWDGSSWQ